MSKFQIRHITQYVYNDIVRDSANQIMLYPIIDEFQSVVDHSITISGEPIVNVHEDYFGNQVGTFTHAFPHQELKIDSNLTVTVRSRPLPTDEQPAEAQWRELNELRHNVGFIDFLRTENFAAREDLKKIADGQKIETLTPLAAAKQLCQYVYDTFEYKKGITTVETTLDELWSHKTGVCQDFAHILLAALRLINIPARYVSGYICPHKNGMRGEGATHAWVEAYIPFFGWLGFDPTNNCVVNDTHVRLAIGKKFSDVSPVRGTYRGTSDHTMHVSVAVSYEDGHTVKSNGDVITTAEPTTTTSVYKNSFQRYQAMQIQQQQQ